MATPAQLDALRALVQEARASQHIWPEMAACEACLETAWLTSELGREYRNLFGQKCPIVDGNPTPPDGVLKVSFPTQEWDGTKYVGIRACFLWFTSFADAFSHRMALLEGAAVKYPAYAAALHASTAQEYVLAVSRTWSTDPARGSKCIEIYNAHRDVLTAV
ncbi:MAG TPA: glucosaminidase domain-containing protein [Edaphobacter sp.]|nr:glucosaminidase domain-containing protein [Edaphobacter sp.]